MRIDDNNITPFINLTILTKELVVGQYSSCPARDKQNIAKAKHNSAIMKTLNATEIIGKLTISYQSNIVIYMLYGI